jgi:ATP-dependent DNA ligase
MKHIEFCIPTAGKAAPSGPDWIHEVKYDGYRLRVQRNGDHVWLLSKGGHDSTSRYPWIVETARKIRQKQFILDGEAVVLGVDGISDFNALHSRFFVRYDSTPDNPIWGSFQKWVQRPTCLTNFPRFALFGQVELPQNHPD